MTTRYQYVTPDGTMIIGSLETVMGKAEIDCFDKDGNVEYGGYTEMFWDEQRTVERDGKDVYIDDNGDEWTLDECRLVSEDEIEEQD